jgi:hypothetical protein
MRPARMAVVCVTLLSVLTRMWAVGPLTGRGTATIDGIFSAGEWDAAGFVQFDANLPGGGATPAGLWVMNDSKNLYLAVQFQRDVADPGNSLGFEFDSNRNGVLDEGDDSIVMNSLAGFFDDYRTTAPPCPPGVVCGPGDTDAAFGPPGTIDGAGVFLHDGSLSTYEISHPLDSGDTGHDFALLSGEDIGFSLFLRILGEGGQFPIDFGDTEFPGFPFGGTIDISSVPETGSTSVFLALAFLGVNIFRRRNSARRVTLQA